ncbi:MAG: protein translocase subunit SecF [Actinomycetota bacterium]|nr:protein translocase subunit SecF [Actinomycetota bacterium]
MNVLTRMYRGETHFDFVGTARKTLLVSAGLVVLSLLLLLVRPLNLSIDFTGGVIVTVENQSDVDIDDVRAALGDIGQAGARVQLTGEGFILIQTEALDAAAQDELIVVAASVGGTDVNSVTIDAVGPTFGAEVTRAAIQALVVFLLIVALFITWRFEWKMALAALAALFHDLIITAGIFAAFGFVVTPATVIALLTILGYSLYDTVVVFDKVDENVELMHDRYTYTEIVNTSMNQVLMRSINTSLTSLLPVGSLLLVGSFALGAHTLREFALALFIGIAIGTYSSIFVAAPLLAFWKEREEDWVVARKRAMRRRGGDASLAVGSDVLPMPEPVPAAPSAPTGASGAAARAPRKRKKRR